MQPGAPHTASLPAGCAHGSTPLPGTRRGLRAAAGTQAPLHRVKTKFMLARDLCTPCMSPQGKRCFLPHLTSGVTALTATSSFQESVDRKRQAGGPGPWRGAVAPVGPNPSGRRVWWQLLWCSYWVLCCLRFLHGVFS